MKRYIDTNKAKIKYSSKDVDDIANLFNELIDSQSTADVVEVIRCEDCIHNHTKSWNQGKKDKPSCRFTDLIRSNEFYCGFGERTEA